MSVVSLSPWRLLLLVLAWMVVVGLIMGLIFSESPAPGPSVPRRTTPAGE